ncbi:MAG: hypothetical protein HZB38_02100 [Planctomycetes bacterium]|nr:hypothetical protein [Planctomycetota bacterium]
MRVAALIHPNRFLAALFCVALLVGSALAGMATIHFKDGTKVRGDVQENEQDVVLKTPFGERRYSRDKILRIEYDNIADEPQAAQPKRPPTSASRPAGREKAENEEDEPGEASSRPSRFKGLEPPPVLSERDILRLKLTEYPLDGDPQPVNVEFLKKKGEPTVENAVAQILRDDSSAEIGWERTLEKGRPPEKLQLILRTTGLRFADRIHIRGDTATFNAFRKQVLPTVMRGCGRNGCHGGTSTAYFRFPTGSQSTEEFVYTSFAVLDTIQTRSGPMIDRDLPEESALLKYLMPPPANAAPLHPIVKSGKLLPAIESRESKDYREIAEWISSLRVPKQEYGLEWKPPEWLEKIALPVPEPTSRPADANAEEKQPSSRPAPPDRRKPREP